MAFPTLSSPPTNITKETPLNTISVQFEGGYKQTRERFTREISTFTVDYVLILRADKDLIEAHFNTVRGSTPFTWINVDDGLTHTVRYSGAIKYPATGAVRNRFSITLTLEEV